jgi:hypothetical protein
MTMAYHPQANQPSGKGTQAVERCTTFSWRQHGLAFSDSLVLLGLHLAPEEINGFSSSEAIFGQPLVFLIELNPGGLLVRHFGTS